MENTTPGLGNFMNDFRRDPKQGQTQSQNQYRPQQTQNQSQNQPFFGKERPEMKGPENINSILTGLKKVNVENDSTISAEEVDLMNTNSTSRRKRRSDKNTISLAI
jgi:hypothetical protein